MGNSSLSWNNKITLTYLFNNYILFNKDLRRNFHHFLKFILWLIYLLFYSLIHKWNILWSRPPPLFHLWCWMQPSLYHKLVFFQSHPPTFILAVRVPCDPLHLVRVSYMTMSGTLCQCFHHWLMLLSLPRHTFRAYGYFAENRGLWSLLLPVKGCFRRMPQLPWGHCCNSQVVCR